MEYKVINSFRDLEDNDYIYNVGDTYPREGVTSSDERIAILSSDKNKQKKPLIEEIKEDPAGGAENADKNKGNEGKSIDGMDVKELKAYLKAKNVSFDSKANKAELLELAKAVNTEAE